MRNSKSGVIGSIFAAGAIMLLSAPLSAQFVEGFESYSNGTLLDNIGGWAGWDNVPAAAGTVSTAQARTGSNSIVIGANIDAVHPFAAPFTSGIVQVEAWMFLAQADHTADTYFIVNNLYNHGGPYVWTTQLNFQLSSSNVIAESEGGLGTAPINYNAWTQIRVVYDMDNDLQFTYYNGSLMSTGTVTLDGTQPFEIANIDLFAAGVVTSYFDDLRVENVLLGDVNLDGVVSLLDVSAFVGVLTTGSFQIQADINLDGIVSLLDVSPFVEILSGG